MSDDFDIHLVLESYGWDLPAARTGWVTVKCGAHDDSHQSCRISSDTGYVLCMACGFPKGGKAGDAIDVVRHYEGTGYRDAKRRCEELTGGSKLGVSRTGGHGSRVSGSSRGDARNRKYVPPRLRRGTDDR